MRQFYKEWTQENCSNHLGFLVRILNTKMQVQHIEEQNLQSVKNKLQELHVFLKQRNFITKISKGYVLCQDQRVQLQNGLMWAEHMDLLSGLYMCCRYMDGLSDKSEGCLKLSITHIIIFTFMLIQ